MPRTGTTLLSRLMGQDPELRAPLMWEMALPCPPGKVENFREDKRFKMVEMRRSKYHEIIFVQLMGFYHYQCVNEFDALHTTRRLQWRVF